MPQLSSFSVLPLRQQVLHMLINSMWHCAAEHWVKKEGYYNILFQFTWEPKGKEEEDESGLWKLGTNKMWSVSGNPRVCGDEYQSWHLFIFFILWAALSVYSFLNEQIMILQLSKYWNNKKNKQLLWSFISRQINKKGFHFKLSRLKRNLHLMH